ncbi:hypothetical protein ABTN45_19870, partial [Acinetobacter baumannii]
MISLSRRSLLASSGALLLSSMAGPSVQAATPKRGGTLTATWGGLEPQALFVPPGGGSSPY